MTERSDVDEQLSALADGELGRGEAELLLARLAREPALRARWERYHTIGEALRGALPQRYPVGLPGAVERTLADDRAHAKRGVGAFGRIAMPLVGAAVAAGVALVGVLVVRHQTETPGAPVAPLAAGVERAVPAGAVVVDYSPAMRAKLGGYVVRHGEAAGRALPVVAPHLRVAAKDVEEVPATAPPTAAATEAVPSAGTPP